MAIYSYEIGTTYALRVNVETLSKRPNMSPTSKPPYYPDIVTMASGVIVSRGSLIIPWYFGFMPKDLFTALRVICPAQSKSVIIRSLSEDYTTYVYYSAIMQWPELQGIDYLSGRRQDLTLMFTRALVYTP